MEKITDDLREKIFKEEQDKQDQEVKKQNECIQKIYAILDEYGYKFQVLNPQIGLIKK